jgi:uncharacterized membrane protein
MESNRTVASLILTLFLVSCVEHKTPMREEVPTLQPKQQSSTDTQKQYDFVQVKEMLSRNCTPCHEPGGKMYEKLPFDNPEVIRTHSEPILKRINKLEDKKLMEDWLSEPQH